MKIIDTGDNEPLTKHLLQKIMLDLRAQNRCKLIKKLEDRVGVYAFIMRDAQGQRFYLIAKGSHMWLDVVSCQAHLPSFAEREKTPIILAWLNPDSNELKFYLFDPGHIIKFVEEHLLSSQYGYNERKGVRMINFSLSLGTIFDPIMNLEEAWRRMRIQEGEK